MIIWVKEESTDMYTPTLYVKLRIDQLTDIFFQKLLYREREEPGKVEMHIVDFQTLYEIKFDSNELKLNKQIQEQSLTSL